MEEKLKSVKALVLDVDGVLTDGRIFLDTAGQWRRFFSVKDGVGIKLLKASGYLLGIITGANAEDVRKRAEFLGFDFIYEGATDKTGPFADLLAKSGLDSRQVAYVGDDIYDIPLIKEAGFGVTVPEALDEVREAADYITRLPGGNGAVREVCSLVLHHGAFSEKQGAV